MNSKKKFLIVIIIAVIVVISAIATALIIFNKNNSKPDEKQEILTQYSEETGAGENISQKFQEEKRFENFTLSNSSLTFFPGTDGAEGTTYFIVTAKNNGSETSKKRDVIIEFLDVNGEIVYSASILLDSLEPNSETKLTASLLGDYINIYDYSIKNFE